MRSCSIRCLIRAIYLIHDWKESLDRYIRKGDSTCPQNYRPITILSCLGKLFTAFLYNRMTKFPDTESLIQENQSGFGKDHCASDHILVVSSLVEILKTKTNIYCAFIDFAQAFDLMWRANLWLNSNYLIQSKETSLKLFIICTKPSSRV